MPASIQTLECLAFYRNKRILIRKELDTVINVTLVFLWLNTFQQNEHDSLKLNSNVSTSTCYFPFLIRRKVNNIFAIGKKQPNFNTFTSLQPREFNLLLWKYYLKFLLIYLWIKFAFINFSLFRLINSAHIELFNVNNVFLFAPFVFLRQFWCLLKRLLAATEMDENDFSNSKQ